MPSFALLFFSGMGNVVGKKGVMLFIQLHRIFFRQNQIGFRIMLNRKSELIPAVS